MRGLMLIALLTSGCGELLVVRYPPWADDAQIVLSILDGMGRPVEAHPRLFRGRSKVEISVSPGEEREVVAYEYAAGRTAADGSSSIVDCGATYEAGGTELEPPDMQYRSGVVASADAEGFELSVSTAPLLPLFQVSCNLEPCAGFDTDDVQVPISSNLTAVAGIADRDAIVAGPVAASESITLYRVRSRIPTHLPAGPYGYPVELAYDGRTTIYGAADPADRPGGNVYAFDLDGVPVPTPELHLGEGKKRVAVGRDGSIFASGHDGLFEIVEGSTLAARVDTGGYGVHNLAVARRDRIAISEPQHAILFYDGLGWRVEWTPAVVAAVEILDIAIDEEQAIAVGTVSTLLKRDEVGRVWLPFPGPPLASGATMGSVALLSGGRFVVAFGGGGLAIWNGKAWCETLEPIGASRIVNLVGSPSRNQVFGVSQAEPVFGPKLQIVEAPRL